MSLGNNADQIVERYIPGARLNTAERLTGGVSADVYRLDLLLADGSKDRAVLRVHGSTHCGHSAELEFQLLEALFEAGLLVPKPHCFDASCNLIEHPYLVMDFIDGSSVIAQSKIETCIEMMAEELIAVHRTATGTLPYLPPRMDPLPELFEFLPAGSEWLEFQAYLTKLENTAFEGPAMLLHGDYWPANLVWSDGRIAAILDWEDAALGDPISDVACACLELRYIYGEKGMHLFKNAYAKHSPVENGRLALWLAYVASAAQKHMGGWGLEPSLETHMRRIANETLQEAVSFLR